QSASLPAAETVCQVLQQPSDYDLVVTNLGRLPFGRQFGSLQIEAIYGPAILNGAENEQLVGVMTLGDQLSITVSNPSTTTSEVEANAGLADALNLLSEGIVLPFGNSCYLV
ncbi:MAG TPA: hypothetical protein V6C93_12455, partial [Allocoleopsis sp.]